MQTATEIATYLRANGYRVLAVNTDASVTVASPIYCKRGARTWVEFESRVIRSSKAAVKFVMDNAE